MNVTINRLKVVFLIIFAVGCVSLWAYQIFWVWPAKRCDESGAWWDWSTRVCAQPIYIPSLTGRPEGMSRKEWSMKQAAKQVEREAEGYPTEDVAPPAPAAPAPAKGDTAPKAPAAPKGSAAAEAAAAPVPVKK